MGFEQLAELKKRLQQEARTRRQSTQPVRADAPQAASNAPAAPERAPRGAKPDRAVAGKGPRPAHGKGAPAGRGVARPAGPRQPARPPVDPVVHFISKLQRRFPLAFPKNPAPKVALKIGVLEDLLAYAGELGLDGQAVRDAIATWCRGSRYWASVTEGAPRIDLNGAEVGHVTASEAAFARRRATWRPKGAKPAAAGTQAGAVSASAPASPDAPAAHAEASGAAAGVLHADVPDRDV